MPRLPRSEAPKTADEALAEHLKQAESHLIEAVTLFGKVHKPKRNEIYVRRLTSAQETVTSLHMEELVRARGLQKPPKRKKN